jgi:replicative DNA helicase
MNQMILNKNQVPHSDEAEKSVLSAVFVDNEKIHRVMSVIETEEFYSHRHRSIFSAMCRLSRKRERIDVLTVSAELKTMGKDEKTSDVDYLTVLEGFVPTGEGATHHAKIVKKNAFSRGMIKLSQKVYSESYAMNGEPEEVISIWQKGFSDLSIRLYSKMHGDQVLLPDDMARKAFDGVIKRMENPGVHGIKVGLPLLDNAIMGLKPLNILSASTGMGKTAIALNFAVHIGIEQKIPTLYLNYEMEDADLLTRIQGIITGIHISDIATGKISKEQFKKISEAANKIREGKLSITGNEAKTIDHTLDLIHRNVNLHGVKVVFVDYLGEIEPDGLCKNETDYHTFGRWVQTLKNECSGLGVKLVVLAQLNREGHDDVPSMSKIGGSWQIAQKADVFMVVGFEKKKWHYIKLNKNRNGIQPVTIPIIFDKFTQRIEEGGYEK